MYNQKGITKWSKWIVYYIYKLLMNVFNKDILQTIHNNDLKKKFNVTINIIFDENINHI